MKKLWINTVPGKDKNADQIFYFPQELPKYLRGYHKTSKQDLIELAALVYRARFGNDQSLLPRITDMLEDFIPPDMTKIQTNSQWKSSISSAYLKHGAMSEEEAKEQFLRKIYHLPTFGTAFFEVKQTSDPSYPQIDWRPTEAFYPYTTIQQPAVIFCYYFCIIIDLEMGRQFDFVR